MVELASHAHVFGHPIEHAEFVVEAVLFDMDGTLVDSIGAVEEAWGGVAKELGEDPDEVIAATHGRRAIDNLRDLKPELRRKSDADMGPHVEEFETRILNNADEYQKEVRSRRESEASSRRSSRAASRRASQSASRRPSQPGSGIASPAPTGEAAPRRNSFANELTRRMAVLGFSSMPGKAPSPAESPRKNSASANGVNGTNGKPITDKLVDSPPATDENPFDDDDDEEIDIDAIEVDVSDLKDNSVKILPGVRKLFDSCPLDRVAIATSGAKTYCYGALKRAGIERPKVTITADDPRLKNGKPAPDPFLLAAKEVGYDCKDCLVVEDSPSGIRSGLASGATVIAACTSHPIEKIRDVGATYLVPSLECVSIRQREDGKLVVTIDAELARRTPAHVRSATDLPKEAEKAEAN